MWAFKILSEFFQQGDKERSQGIDITILCDRKTTNIAKSQIGFIDFVVFPYFDALVKIFPQMEFTTKNMTENKAVWTSQIDKYEKKKEENGNEDIWKHYERSF